jgi:hypothetical protein
LWRYRLGLTIVGLLLVANIVSVPVVIVSMIDDLRAFEEVVDLTPAGVEPGESYTFLRIDLLSLDEVSEIANLRVAGSHLCHGCTHRERITLYSIANSEGAPQDVGVPPSVAFTLQPTNQSISQKVELPVHGSLIRYPFDKYWLWLGVTVERLDNDGSAEVLGPEEARKHLFLSLRNAAARIVVGRPTRLDPATVQPKRAQVPYSDVYAVDFFRPDYLRLLVPLVVALIAAAAFYAVGLRPFNELIMNSGGLVLGVWGVRSLLLGGYAPNTTAVDAALTLLIVAVLFVISVRAFRYMWGRSGLRLRSDPPADQTSGREQAQPARTN